TVMRAADRSVIASVDLDLTQGAPDRFGFKYARLPKPVQLDPAPGQPVVIHPRGLERGGDYDVRCAKAGYRARRKGADLMDNGIRLATVEPGELIFLNLPGHPGARTDTTPPTSPERVTKRIGTNLGVQGVEVRWNPARDDNWISYYEILRDGAVEARTAKGTFYFDYAGVAKTRIESTYEVRTVDGDGNRSSRVPAQLLAGD